MPSTSSSKKTSAEAGPSKKTVDVTPLRISSRVRKEKFSVKELFGNAKDKDVSSDDEPSKPAPKKKLADKTVASASKTLNDKDSKLQVVRVDIHKPSTSKQSGLRPQAESTPKPGSSKPSVLSKSGVSSLNKAGSSLGKHGVSSPKPNIGTPARPGSATSRPVTIATPKHSSAVKSLLTGSPKPSLLQSQKPSLLRKQQEGASSTSPSTSKDETKVHSPKMKMKQRDDDLIKLDNIKVEPIFNEDNIDTVLENPGSLGLDIVVTKLSESDQKEHSDSKKSKNVVTIAKMTGSAAASKPIKVVPMKPSDKITELEISIDECKIPSKTLDFKGSGAVITPKIDKNKNTSIILDKKPKVQARPISSNKVQSSNQIKEVKVNKSLGTDVVVVTQTINNKGAISTKVLEKKRDIKQPESKQAKGKQSLIDIELEKCRDQLEISFVDRIKTKDIQRQKAIKRSIMDVMSDVKTNGHRNAKVRSAEADSSSGEVDIKRSRVVEEIFGESEEILLEDNKKQPFEFDRYFTTSESVIEHNESLDSEGSNEENETYLSHFYEKDSFDNNNRKRKINEPYSEDYTIYDLMHEVNCEFPSWNLHVMQDSASFLICQVSRGQHGLPVLSKMIELESDFSAAKVYINSVLHREFSSSQRYNTYDRIRELISSVQQL